MDVKASKPSISKNNFPVGYTINYYGSVYVVTLTKGKHPRRYWKKQGILHAVINPVISPSPLPAAYQTQTQILFTVPSCFSREILPMGIPPVISPILPPVANPLLIIPTKRTEIAIKYNKKKDPYFEFSNFYEIPVILDGVRWTTVEHFYQSHKYLYPGASETNRIYANIIASASTPYKAYVLARQTKDRFGNKWPINKQDPRKINDVITEYKTKAIMNPKWDSVKDQVMFRVVHAKFDQNPQLATLLKSTGNKQIIENVVSNTFQIVL